MSKEAVTNWKDWSDVFASAIVIPGDHLNKFSARSMPERTAHTFYVPRFHGKENDWKGQVPMYLSRFCRLKRLDRIFYLDVMPTKQAIKAVERNSTFVEHDTMNFEVIEWKDGQSLVVCHNSKIIGGPWVAKINSVTIPDFKED